MKKLACALLLVVGATVALQATPRCNSQGCHRGRGEHQRSLPNPGTLKQQCGFAQVSLQDLEITESEILATIDGKALPIRALFIGKEGTVFVKTCSGIMKTCSQCQNEYKAGRSGKRPCPQCKTTK